VFDQIILNFEAKLTDTVVDYEHASRFLGEEAPAAGWIKLLEVRKVSNKLALFAQVEWNEKAAEYIRKREYKYVSPTVIWNSVDPRSGQLRGAYLHSLALTNTPFLEELPEVSLKRDAAGQTEHLEEGNMEEYLKAIALKLGLKEDAEPQAVVDAVGELHTLSAQRGTDLKAVYTRLDLGEDATSEQAVAQVVSMKRPVGEVDAARLQAVETELAEQKADKVVARAQKAGKLTAAKEQVDWFRGYAMKDPEAAEAWLKHAPQAVPVEERKRAKGTKSKDAPLTPEEVTYCKQMDLTEEEFRKYNSEDEIEG